MRARPNLLASTGHAAEYSTYFRPQGLTASRRCTRGSSGTPTGPIRTRPGRSRSSSAERPGSRSTPPSSAPARESCSCSSPRPSTPGWPRSRRAGRTRCCTSSRGSSTTGTSATRPRPAPPAGWCSATVALRGALERAHAALAAEPAGDLAVEEAVPARGRRPPSPSAARTAGARTRSGRARRGAPGPGHLRERWDQRVTLAATRRRVPGSAGSSWSAASASRTASPRTRSRPTCASRRRAGCSPPARRRPPSPPPAASPTSRT